VGIVGLMLDESFACWWGRRDALIFLARSFPRTKLYNNLTALIIINTVLFPTLFTFFFSRCLCPAQITSPCQCISTDVQHMFLGRVYTQCAFKGNAVMTESEVGTRSPAYLLGKAQLL
jgi:hypothetical protein